MVDAPPPHGGLTPWALGECSVLAAALRMAGTKGTTQVRTRMLLAIYAHRPCFRCLDTALRCACGLPFGGEGLSSYGHPMSARCFWATFFAAGCDRSRRTCKAPSTRRSSSWTETQAIHRIATRIRGSGSPGCRGNVPGQSVPRPGELPFRRGCSRRNCLRPFIKAGPGGGAKRGTRPKKLCECVAGEMFSVHTPPELRVGMFAIIGKVHHRFNPQDRTTGAGHVENPSWQDARGQAGTAGLMRLITVPVTDIRSSFRRRILISNMFLVDGSCRRTEWL